MIIRPLDLDLISVPELCALLINGFLLEGETDQAETAD
jgi:hypothetical protein